MVVRIAAGLLLLTALAPVASQLCAANATPTAASLNVQLTPSVVELHKPTLVSVDGGAVRPGDRVVLLQEGDESSMELFVLDSSFTINVNYVTLGTRLARTPWPHLESSAFGILYDKVVTRSLAVAAPVGAGSHDSAHAHLHSDHCPLLYIRTAPASRGHETHTRVTESWRASESVDLTPHPSAPDAPCPRGVELQVEHA